MGSTTSPKIWDHFITLYASDTCFCSASAATPQHMGTKGVKKGAFKGDVKGVIFKRKGYEIW